ncbi:hypothetical protein MTBLM1_130040 [Rhodospirillaceae bacterium LM-1]|nr:hypothetical protein MTBLM1_130040 [Rhodospirillaceae bacterium LM-1]
MAFVAMVWARQTFPDQLRSYVCTVILKHGSSHATAIFVSKDILEHDGFTFKAGEGFLRRHGFGSFFRAPGFQFRSINPIDSDRSLHILP